MAAVATGVTVGSRTVRVLQVRRQKTGAWTVVQALIVPLKGAEPSESERVGELRAALQTAQAKGKALVGLSGRDLIVRYTQVPPVPDWRLEMLMNFEIQEVAEQSGGDVSAAYALLDVDDTSSGDNVVLVALAKNGYLNPRLNALKNAGLTVLGGTPRAVAAFHSYKENGHLRFDETVLIMHIGHENTDVAVARKGALLFARNISGGSKLFTDALMQNMRVNFPTAEKMKIKKGNLTPKGKAKYRDSGEEKVANNMMGVAGHFVSAFNSSVMFAKAQTKVPDCQPDRIVLMGGGALLRGLPEYLESNLGIPVELFDPLDSVDLSELDKAQADMVRQDQGGMAVTLGLAQMVLDDEAMTVEVLPEAERKKRHFMEHTLLSIASAGVLVVALIVAFAMSGSAESAGNAEVATLNDAQNKHNTNTDEFNKAENIVGDLNDEKFKLRRAVSMGPAWQIITDAVQSVLNDKGPFDEVFIRKVSGSLRSKTTADPSTGETVVEFLPTVEFHASIQSLGARSEASAYTDFNVALKGYVKNTGYLEFVEMGGFDSDSKSFKFRVVQTRFPEYAAASSEGEGE